VSLGISREIPIVGILGDALVYTVKTCCASYRKRALFRQHVSDQASTYERQYRGTRKKYVRTLLFLLHVTSSPYSVSGWLPRELKALQVIAPLRERSHGRPGQ
jgi:hypothetical protein